jgi:hypothetical protein
MKLSYKSAQHAVGGCSDDDAIDVEEEVEHVGTVKED